MGFEFFAKIKRFAYFFSFSALIFTGFGFLALEGVKADIRVDVDRTFEVSILGEMTVEEIETITNTFSDRFIPGGTKRSYYLVISAQDEVERQAIADRIYNSLSVQVNGQTTAFERINNNGNFGISYVLTRRLNPGGSQQISLTYKHPELAEKTGGVLDAYIPAFDDNFQFQLDNTNYNYTTKLLIPENAGVESVLSVDPVNRSMQNGYDVYEFAQSSLLGKFVWVQRGNKQIYKFSITQDLPANTSSLGGVNEYQVVLPRNVLEVNIEQKVYFTEITPAPVAVRQDDNGNILGLFRVAADESQKLTISGYAELNISKVDITNSGKIGDIAVNLPNFQSYLQPAEYWEVDAPEIRNAARNSFEGSVNSETNVYEVLSQVYETVVNTIDYSQVKRFGLNERQGALRTLQGGAAVCMEYSDLYLTKLRSLGIPARAVFGYGYDSRLPAGEQEPHQWVQVYLPEFDGWITVDVTWGESGIQVLGGDLNHFFTHVAVSEPNEPPVLSRTSFSAGSFALSAPVFEIEVLENLPSDPTVSGWLTQTDLLEMYPPTSNSADFLLENFVSKFIATLENLFVSPGRIDSQGWFLLISAFMLLMVVLYILAQLGAKILTRRKIKV